MIVKSILSEDLMTLAEVKEALEEIRLRRAEEPEELGYELRRAIKHAEIFSQGEAAESRKMVEELLGLEKMTKEIATKNSRHPAQDQGRDPGSLRQGAVHPPGRGLGRDPRRGS